jgi:hypothetical protein
MFPKESRDGKARLRIPGESLAAIFRGKIRAPEEEV